MHPTKMINPQSGNVLFYILIAVALFAALSFVVSTMMRGSSGGSISKEKSGLYASEILTYAKQIDDVVKSIQILNDCRDEEVSFENPTISGYEHSPAVRDECKVFHSDGGAMTYRAEADWFDDSYASFSHNNCPFGDAVFSGGNSIPNVGSVCSGNDCKDLLLVMHYVPKEVCVAINKRLDIDNDYSGDWPPPERVSSPPGGLSTSKFTGVYGAAPSGVDNGVSGALAACLTVECSAMSSPDYTLFYYVLKAR